MYVESKGKKYQLYKFKQILVEIIRDTERILHNDDIAKTQELHRSPNNFSFCIHSQQCCGKK